MQVTVTIKDKDNGEAFTITRGIERASMNLDTLREAADCWLSEMQGQKRLPMDEEE